MRSVILHGRLRRKFGGPFKFACSGPIEAVKLLVANFPEFAGEISKGYYRIIVGSLKKGMELEERMLPMIFPESKTIHIIPTIAGAKGGGAKAIIGIAIIGVAAIATGGFGFAGAAPMLFSAGTWGSIAMVGASLALTGISQMLTPVPKAPDITQREPPDQRPSFMLGGAVNVIEQGHPIPLVGGENILGGIVISVGIDVEEVPA